MLVKLVEMITRRIQAGETVDIEELAREYPSWAGTLRQLFAGPLCGLAELGKAVDNDGLERPGVRSLRPGPPGAIFGDFRIVRPGDLAAGGMGIAL